VVGLTNINDSVVNMYPRCNKECRGRRPCPACDVDMVKHDESDADTNADHYIHCNSMLIAMMAI